MLGFFVVIADLTGECMTANATVGPAGCKALLDGASIERRQVTKKRPHPMRKWCGRKGHPSPAASAHLAPRARVATTPALKPEHRRPGLSVSAGCAVRTHVIRPPPTTSGRRGSLLPAGWRECRARSRCSGSRDCASDCRAADSRGCRTKHPRRSTPKAG